MQIFFFRFTIFLILILFSIPISLGETFFKRGFKFNILNDNEVSIIVFEGCDREALNLEIPSEVRYLGKIYKVTTIGRKAFALFKNIEEVNLPNTIRTIEREAFEYCKNIQKIYIPASVTKIGGGAFWGCNNLREITIRNPHPPQIIGDGGGQWCADNIFYQVIIYVPFDSEYVYKTDRIWRKFLNIEGIIFNND